MTQILAGTITLALIILVGLPLIYILMMATIGYLKFVFDIIDRIGIKIKEAIL